MQLINKAGGNMLFAKLTGVARESRARTLTFEDPAWDPVFDELIKLTQRTDLVLDLTGTDVKIARLKDAISARLKEMDFVVKRPRGKGRRTTAKSFLGSPAERHDAAYLVSLYFGSRDCDFSEPQNLNLLCTAQRLIQVYRTYVRDMYQSMSEAKIKFETFILLVNALKSRERYALFTCRDCGSRQPSTKGESMRMTCQICKLQKLDAKAAKLKIDALLSARDSAPGQQLFKLAAPEF